MCFTRVAVIVIVISRDDSGAGLLKHINVGDKSTMVARLPQQVFLLLALVTGTTMGLGGAELPKSTSSSRPRGEAETSGGRASDEMLLLLQQQHRTIDPLGEARSVTRPVARLDDSSSRTKSLGANSEHVRWSETRRINSENAWARRVVDESASSPTSPTRRDDHETQKSAEGFARRSWNDETPKTKAPSVSKAASADESPSLQVPRTMGYHLVLSSSNSRPSSAPSSSSSMTSTRSGDAPSAPTTSPSTKSSRSSNSPTSFHADGLYTEATVSTLAKSRNTRRRAAKFRQSFAADDENGARERGKRKNGKLERLDPESSRVTRDLRAETAEKLGNTGTEPSSNSHEESEGLGSAAKLDESFFSDESFSDEAEQKMERNKKLTEGDLDYRAEMSKKLAAEETSSRLPSLGNSDDESEVLGWTEKLNESFSDESFSDEAEQKEERNKKLTEGDRDYRTEMSKKLATEETSSRLPSLGNSNDESEGLGWTEKLDESFSDEVKREEEGDKNSETNDERLEPKLTPVDRDFLSDASRTLATEKTSSRLASSSNSRDDRDGLGWTAKLNESFSDETFSDEAEPEEERDENSETDVERLETKLTRVDGDFRADTSRKLATAKTSSTLAESVEKGNYKNRKTDVDSVEAKLTEAARDFRAETSNDLATGETSRQTRIHVKAGNASSAVATRWSRRGNERETGRPGGWLTGSRAATLTPDAGLSYPRRYARDAADNNNCEKFEIGDPEKREFYSPNYPQNYPPLTDCVLVLEAEKGMLLKLDFREQFELETKSPEGECRFDYLEVRDGQYGFSPRKGIYCDKDFPPEIHSQGRYLWLNFHSDDTIEYRGFKAVWSTFPRPNTAYPPEQEPCIYHEDIPADFELKTDTIKDAKKLAESNGVALDCLWVLKAPDGMKMQLTFDNFKLEKPNDCSANFLDIFDGQTDEPSRMKKFCGSIAEAISTRSSVLYVRLYLELKAINSSFSALITAVRDKESNQDCKAGEFDCQDATCIAESLRCNKRRNCRFQRDEDDTECGTFNEKQDRSRIVIILVIFSLIMFGMCSAFLFNCVRKLRRDHRIIREHIRQSREDRLDEIGRRATPCPLSVSRTDLRDGASESPPGEEVDSSKELIPSAALTARDYTKDLGLQINYGNDRDITDIHQSNNVSNATQERLQESSEEPDMCDSSCQTRESLFAPTFPDAILSSPPAGFSTFGYRNVVAVGNAETPSHKGTTGSPTSSDHYQRHNNHHHHPQRQQHHHHRPAAPPMRQTQRPSQDSNRSDSQSSSSQADHRCSHESCAQICPRHNTIPAPPGWSLHDPPYPQILPESPAVRPAAAAGDDSTYRRYQSPKPEHETVAPGAYQHQHQHQHQTTPQPQQHQYQYPHFTRQNTVGSGERYGSFIYGSGRASSSAPSSNATTNTATTTTAAGSNATGSPHSSSSTTPGKQQHQHRDPRYRAEAVIEVDQKRPFSIESTKSAPDVIATH